MVISTGWTACNISKYKYYNVGFQEHKHNKSKKKLFRVLRNSLIEALVILNITIFKNPLPECTDLGANYQPSRNFTVLYP
jgi:hypothetical protein